MPASAPLTSGQPDPVMLFDVALGLGANPSWQVEVTGLAVDRAVYLLGPVVGGSTELLVVDKLGAASVPRRIDGRWTDIAVLSGPDRSLLALLGSGQLGIHDPMSGLVSTVALPAEAHGIAADIGARLIYVGLPDQIAVLDPDAGRRCYGIAVPGRPTEIVCAENGTLAVLLESRQTHAVAIAESNASRVEVIDLPDGCRPRNLSYDTDSGLIFLSVADSAIEPAGIAVIDRDCGRRIGGVIETGRPPATLTLLRCGPRTHLYAGVPGAGLVGFSGGLEVVDVARRAVVGRLCAPWVGACAVADQPAGELYIADRFGGVRRILPLIGGSPIERHVTRSTGTDWTTAPLTGPRTTPDGSTEMQKFDIGTIVASTDAGAVIVDPTHADLWLSAMGPADGAPTAAQLGNPVGDTITEDDHLVTYFERGLIVTMPLNGSTTVAVPEPRFDVNFRIEGLGEVDELQFLLDGEP